MFKLTEKQKQFLHTKKLKIGRWYTFPDKPFYVYIEPNWLSDKTLIDAVTPGYIRGAYFEVVEIKDDFLGGVVHSKMGRVKMYIKKWDILYRTNGEVWVLYFFCYLPMIIYNLFTKIIKK